MQKLADRSREITAEHAGLIEELQRLQSRIDELNRQHLKDSN